LSHSVSSYAEWPSGVSRRNRPQAHHHTGLLVLASDLD